MLYPPFYIFPREFFQNFLRKLVEIFLLQMRLFFGKMLVIIYINFLSFHFRPLPKACFLKKQQGASKFHEFLLIFFEILVEFFIFHNSYK